MKKEIKKIVEIGFIGVVFLLTSLNSSAQPAVIEPGDKSINPALISTGNFAWGTNITNKERMISVQRNNQVITFEERETRKGLDIDKQTLVLNAKTLEPIRQSFTGEEVSYELQYGARIKGNRTVFETNKKQSLDEEVSGKFFDIASLGVVISSLPLSPNYRAIIPVVRLNNLFKPEYLRYRITDVSESNNVFSCLSGVNQVWVVTAEAQQKYKYIFYINKTTRRILREEFSADGMGLSSNTAISIDKETDINPIKASFNADEVKGMLTGGTSSIKGQASTTDGAPKGLLQRSKKQYAPKGSIVVLIPNTPYFKEWVDFNLTIGKISPPVYLDVPDLGPKRLVQGCAYPLPAEIKKHHLLTDVLDDKGNFVFQNLKPGEYLVFVGFVANKYTHTTRTPNGTYSVVINSDGTGSATQNVDVTQWSTPQNILNYKFIKVSKEGETVDVKLN